MPTFLRSKSSIVEENESLKRDNKYYARIQETTEDRLADAQREHELELRYAQERHEDALAAAAREHSKALAQKDKEKEDALKSKDVTIAKQASEILQLEIDSDIEARDVDLEVREQLLNFTTQHLNEVTALQIKIAQLEAAVKVAAAEGTAAKDYVKNVLELTATINEDAQEMSNSLIKKMPNIDLNNLSIAVSVPSKQENKNNK